MNERIGGNAPDLSTIQNRGAVELENFENGCGPDCNQETGDNRDRDMQSNQDGRDINGIAPHPGDWTVVIGGSDSEHTRNKQPAF